MKRFVFLFNFVLFCLSGTSFLNANLEQGFGAWAIGEDLYKFILSNVKEGETIVELGSGYSTKILSDHFQVYTVEHDKKFLKKNQKYMDSGKYPVHFILAPIVSLENGRNWYNPNILKKSLPKKSSLVLVDGPFGRIGRYSFHDYLQLFSNTDFIIFDDANRSKEKILIEAVSKKLGKPYKLYGAPKTFAVICLK